MTASRKARRAAPARPAKRPRSAGKSLVPTQPVEPLIRILRGHKIMLDSDLAALYGVPTKSLNLAVRRNAGRFPGDFMFQLTAAETESLRLQSETSKPERGGRRYLPYAFTEPGVAMLSSMLRSERAVRMNILIMRSFIRLRELVASNRRIEVEGMKTPPPGKKRRIGFLIDDAARSQTATGALRADS